MTSPLVRGTYSLVTFSNGLSFPRSFLKDALPDAATALFFASVYKLTPEDVSVLLREVVKSDVAEALLGESDLHSTDLQDYLVDEYWDGDRWVFDVEGAREGEVDEVREVHAEILPEVWKSLEIVVADSIQTVADTVRSTVAHMPGKTGTMVFQTLAKVNAKRPTIGDYKAGFHHEQVQRVLVVFDVSGSMSETTVRTVVDDVVGLAYESNAALAIVSNSATFWEAGSYSTDVVLDAAEYGGTHYEELASLFEQNWDVVITIADYDSSPSAKRVLAQCGGRIQKLLDISLVNRSTFLAECLGQLADEVRPILVSSTNLCGW